LSKTKSLNQVGSSVQGAGAGMVVIQAQTGLKGEKADNLKLSQARAMVVRQYLVDKFKIDHARIKTMGLGEDEQATPDSSGRISILVYSAGAHSRVEARGR